MIYSRDLLALWYWNCVQKQNHQEALVVMKAIDDLCCAISSRKKRERFLKVLKKYLFKYGICPQTYDFCETFGDDYMFILNGKVKILEEIKRDCNLQDDFRNNAEV